MYRSLSSCRKDGPSHTKVRPHDAPAFSDLNLSDYRLAISLMIIGLPPRQAGSFAITKLGTIFQS
jgi:hypothetical protein